MAGSTAADVCACDEFTPVSSALLLLLLLLDSCVGGGVEVLAAAEVSSVPEDVSSVTVTVAVGVTDSLELALDDGATGWQPLFQMAAPSGVLAAEGGLR